MSMQNVLCENGPYSQNDDLCREPMRYIVERGFREGLEGSRILGDECMSTSVLSRVWEQRE